MNKIERLLVNSNLLRTFLAIAENENLTYTANVLGRTQSAISVQIQKLEDILSVKLFNRQARGMTLTPEGKKLLPLAHRIILDIQRVPSLFEAPLKGQIRVGIPDDYAETILEKMLAEFARRHPGVEIFTRCGCTSKFPSAIEKKELDIAIYSGIETTQEETILVYEPNIWAASENLKWDKISAVPLVILDRDCWWRDLPIHALEKAGREWEIVFSSDNFASMKAAIRAGLAIGVLPKSVIDSSMIEYREQGQLPELPASIRSLLINQSAPENLVQAMTEVIKAVIV